MTTALGPNPVEMRRQLVAALVDAGSLCSPKWIAAFLAIPRETFVHRFVVVDATGRLAEHDLAGADPAAALRAVYTDSALLTQWDAGGTATSSSTAPSLMALMLERLDAYPSHRVLEVGTGTGYNAALICHALGAGALTTMDIHPQLVEQAADRLGLLGYTPHVVIGDGRDRMPDLSTYDRIIATCGFDRIPAAWRLQLTDNGVVVVNVGFGMAVLHATATGLAGPFVDQAEFTAARIDTVDVAFTVDDALALVTATWSGRRERTANWAGSPNTTATASGIAFLRAILMPGVSYIERHSEQDGSVEVTLVDPVSASWSVAAGAAGGSEVLLAEHGPRPLWDELVNMVTEWHDHGRPTPDRYGLTVRLDGTHMLWLDTPERVVRVLPHRPEAR